MESFGSNLHYSLQVKVSHVCMCGVCGVSITCGVSIMGGVCMACPSWVVCPCPCVTKVVYTHSIKTVKTILSHRRLWCASRMALFCQQDSW